MKKCPSCRANCDDSARTCSACGASILTSRRTPKPQSEQDPPGAAGLIPEPGLWSTAGKIGARPSVTKRPHGEGRSERHFLVPAFGAPIKLETLTTTVIGRDEDCDVRIASPTVSRRHAELTLRGLPPRAHVRDLGTRNGTRVNGERIEAERELEDGDVLRLGEVEAVYRVLAAGASEDALCERKGGETVGIAKSSVDLGLSGSLALLPIADLLARLEKLGATGTLKIDAEGSTARVTFQGGQIRDAEVGGRVGDEARELLKKLDAGRFRFEPGDPEKGDPDEK